LKPLFYIYSSRFLTKNSIDHAIVDSFIRRKEHFAERSKILAGYRKVILLNYQNNYIERSN